MSNSRREFLKGSCALLGAGALVPASAGLARASSGEPTAERTGPRYALLVDVQKCLAAGGCTACTQACHAAHNVPSIPEPNHEVKWLWKESFRHAFPTQVHAYSTEHLVDKPVMVLCNHCENPPCVPVCPTTATYSRKDGIVLIDWDRCIGCGACIQACPYEQRFFVRRDEALYSASQVSYENPGAHQAPVGVPVKCDFCFHRVDQGRQPACVETCPTKARVFGKLDGGEKPLNELISRNNARTLMPEMGTLPNVHYF